MSVTDLLPSISIGLNPYLGIGTRVGIVVLPSINIGMIPSSGIIVDL